MSATLTLIHIIGSVCLLLWGTRMVRIGIIRAFGSGLRKTLAFGTKNRIMALLSGIGVTMFLQSSTASALIISTFVGRGFVTVSAGIAAIIGADIGTTIVAQVLIFDLSWIAPALLAIGVILHMAYENGGKARHFAEIIIGLGVMLLALGLIRQASLPLQESEIIPVLLQPLSDEPILAIILAIILTWMAHSSLVIVLLFVSLAATGVLPLHLAFILVLGANIGGTLPAIIATSREGRREMIVPVANLFIRSFGVLVILPFLPLLWTPIEAVSGDISRQIVLFHTGFNIVLAIAFLPFVSVIGRICEGLLIKNNDSDSSKDDPARPRYLDDSALHTPSVALAAITRETLRMAEHVEQMLHDTIEAFRMDDMRLAQHIQERDDILDNIYVEIKHYMANLTRESLDPIEADRYLQLLTFATNLEYIGDVIDKNLMQTALKKIRYHMIFSKEGFEEIEQIHSMTLENMRLVQNVIVMGDAVTARQLVEQKEKLKKKERKAYSSHMQRIGMGVKETIDTSSLHLDILRDYMRINSYITAVAYSILEATGQLHKTRLRKTQ